MVREKAAITGEFRQATYTAKPAECATIERGHRHLDEDLSWSIAMQVVHTPPLMHATVGSFSPVVSFIPFYAVSMPLNAKPKITTPKLPPRLSCREM
jgi:hypothetical protein